MHLSIALVILMLALLVPFASPAEKQSPRYKKTSTSAHHLGGGGGGLDRRKLLLEELLTEEEEERPDEEDGDDDEDDSGGGGGGTGGGGSSVCGSCKVREELKQRNLEAIKGEVLRRMGFHSAPNVTGRVLPQVPAHVLAQVETGYGGLDDMMQADAPYQTGPKVFVEDDDDHIKTETVITFAQQYPRLRHNNAGLPAHTTVLHFPFTDALTKYHVTNATLYVFVQGVEKRPLPTFHLEVFQVVTSASGPNGGTTYKGSPASQQQGGVQAGDATLVRRAVRKVTQTVGRGEWVQVDLTELVSEWFKGGGARAENVGFVVNGSVGGRRVVQVEVESTSGEGNKAPFVEIKTREAKRRTRRNVGLNCDDKTNQPLCCRYPLTVDFEAFGWDFIIAPKKYEAHYCAGECPVFTLQKFPHTHLKKMAAPNSGAPCCAPRKLSAISMLYFDQQLNVVYGSLPGMVVDRCGCA